MHDREPVGSSRNYGSENLPWMTGAFVHRPKADPVPCIGTKPGVHHHDNHALLVGFIVGLRGDDLQPELQQVLGRVGGDGAGILADAGDGDPVGRAGTVLCRVPNYADPVSDLLRLTDCFRLSARLLTWHNHSELRNDISASGGLYRLMRPLGG